MIAQRRLQQGNIQGAQRVGQYTQLLNAGGGAYWLYGTIIMFKSKPECGEEMWHLQYVLFWIMISFPCLICCCAGVAGAAAATCE